MLNRKIAELAEQAFCHVDGTGYGEGNLEDFANMIISKCVELATDESKHSIEQYFKEDEQ